jgi:hypothetical protein
MHAWRVAYEEEITRIKKVYAGRHVHYLYVRMIRIKKPIYGNVC